MSAVLIMMAALGYSEGLNLTGRWESKPNVNGNVTGVIFKADNSFEGYVNKKPFLSGNYSMQKDTISFTDNGCNNALARYRVILFSNNDSMKFELLSDDCEPRRNGMKKLVLGRVIKAQ